MQKPLKKEAFQLGVFSSARMNVRCWQVYHACVLHCPVVLVAGDNCWLFCIFCVCLCDEKMQMCLQCGLAFVYHCQFVSHGRWLEMVVIRDKFIVNVKALNKTKKYFSKYWFFKKVIRVNIFRYVVHCYEIFMFLKHKVDFIK